MAECHIIISCERVCGFEWMCTLSDIAIIWWERANHNCHCWHEPIHISLINIRAARLLNSFPFDIVSVRMSACVFACNWCYWKSSHSFKKNSTSQQSQWMNHMPFTVSAANHCWWLILLFLSGYYLDAQRTFFSWLLVLHWLPFAAPKCIRSNIFLHAPDWHYLNQMRKELTASKIPSHFTQRCKPQTFHTI